MTNESTRVLAAEKDGIVQIRIIGRASLKISRELREFGLHVIDEDLRTITVDLSECEGMDSTFMGVLAMIALKGRGRAEFFIVNADEDHRRLLNGIGVGRLWHFAEAKVEKADWQNLCKAATEAADMDELGPTVLEAHRTLMDLEPENIPVFQDVVDLLAEEVIDNSKKGNQNEN